MAAVQTAGGEDGESVEVLMGAGGLLPQGLRDRLPGEAAATPQNGARVLERAQALVNRPCLWHQTGHPSAVFGDDDRRAAFHVPHALAQPGLELTNADALLAQSSSRSLNEDTLYNKWSQCSHRGCAGAVFKSG